MGNFYKMAISVAMLFVSTAGHAQSATLFNSWTTDYGTFSSGQVAGIFGVSTNGQYAVGYGDVANTSLIWNKEGNAVNDIISPDEDVTGKVDAFVMDVADNGTAVGLFFSKDNKMVMHDPEFSRFVSLPGYRTIDGTWHSVELVCDSAKFAGQNKSGQIVKISGDAQLMGGFIQNEDGTKTIPALWNGEGKLIKPLIAGPDCNFFKMTAMSDDGSVLAGYKASSNLISIYSTLDGVIYINGEWKDVAYTYPANANDHRSIVTSVSDNGAYAGGYVYYDTLDAKGTTCIVTKGFLLDVSNGSYTWLDKIVPSVVTNDGTLYGRSIYDEFVGTTGIATAVRYKDGQLEDVKTWLTDNYALAETSVAFSDISAVSEPVDGEFVIAGCETTAGGMHGAERYTTPFIVTIAAGAEEEYVTDEVGTVVDADGVKVTYFDTPMALSGSMHAISSDGMNILGSNGANSFVYNRANATLRRLNCPEYKYEDESGALITAKACYAYGIADNGTIAGYYVCSDSVAPSGEACGIAGVYKNGKWSALARLAGVALQANGFDGCGRAITADGSLIAGAVPDREFHYMACTWTADGKLKDLLPGGWGAGTMATAISDNGNVIGGWIGDASNGNAAVWINKELTIIGEANDCGTVHYVSHNGRYAVGQILKDTATSTAYVNGFIYDTETGSTLTNKLKHENANGNVITGISEDGKIIIGYSVFADITSRRPFVIIDGQFYDLDEYVKTLGFIPPTAYASYSLFTPLSISTDGKVISGIVDADGMRMAYVLEIKDVKEASATIYGYNTYSADDKLGMAKITTSDATDIDVYVESELIPYSGVYADGTYYLAVDKGSTPWTMDAGIELVSFDYLTGTEKSTIGKMNGYPIDMTYNKSDGKVYTLTTENLENVALTTIDLATGAETSSVVLDGLYVSLASNADGVLYGINTSGDLCILNKEDGSSTVVGNTGLLPTFGFMQDAEFDRDNNILYWVASVDEGEAAYFCTIDFNDGFKVSTQKLPKCNTIVGLFVSPTADGISDITSGSGNALGKVLSSEVYKLDGTLMRANGGNANLNGLPADMYIIKTNTGNGSKTIKAIKK